jgi:hypothetical protein
MLFLAVDALFACLLQHLARTPGGLLLGCYAGAVPASAAHRAWRKKGVLRGFSRAALADSG